MRDQLQNDIQHEKSRSLERRQQFKEHISTFPVGEPAPLGGTLSTKNQ